MFKARLIFAIFAMQSIASMANVPGVTLGTPEYGGTGCPAGSAAVAIAPDAQSLSILFDRFVSEAGGITGRSMDRKTCNIAVPVNVPNGYSVSVFQIDYRGFNSLPFGAYSVFNVEYFFAGVRGPVYEKRFDGHMEGQYLLNNTLIASAVTWSPCGKPVILRANSGMMVRTNGAQAMSTVDSVDISAGLIFNLRWRRC